MLWSQIKLTSYDFSDVHITGEFDNRPGTGRFLRTFSCVVTYRTGAVRRLYIKNIGRCPTGHRTMSYGALPALWKISRTPYGARPILHEFSRAIMVTFTPKCAIIPHKKQVVQIKKIQTDSDSDCDENHTCSRLQTFQFHFLHVIHHQMRLKTKYIFIYIFGLQK